MKLFTTLCASAAVATALTVAAAPNAASAQTPQEVLPLTTDTISQFRTWRNWQVLRNESRGHCLATMSDESGVIQICLTQDETLGYIGVFVQEEIPAGASNDVVIKVGDQTFVGETSGPVGNLGGGWHGGYVLANNQDFRRSIERNNTLTAFPDQPWAVQLDITGANNAIFEVRQCSDSM